MRHLVVARLPSGIALRRHNQVVDISVLLTRVTTLHLSRNVTLSLQHELVPLRVVDVTKHCRVDSPRTSAWRMATRRSPNISVRSARPVPVICCCCRIPTLAFLVDLIARRTVPHARSRTSSSTATVYFLHSSRRDYLADERIVHTRCIRKRIGWAKKVWKKKKTTATA